MSGAYGIHGVLLIVEAAFGYEPFEVTPSWTDISKYVHRVVIRRGAQSTPLPRTVAGQCMLTLNNDDDRFDPNNGSSPYDPDVVLSVPIRVRATWDSTTYPLYYGFASTWNVTYLHTGFRSVAVVPCVDALQLFNQHNIGNETYPVSSVSSRNTAVLDDIGWPAGWRASDNSLGWVEAFPVDADNRPEISAYQHLVNVANADAGRIYIGANGDFVFYNRVHYDGGGPVAGTFGPVSADLDYSNMTPKYDDDHLYNDIRITRSEGKTQQVTNAASIAKYRNRTLAQSGIMVDDGAALNIAEWQLARFKDVNPRIHELTIKPQSDPANIWPVVLGIDLRDSIIIMTDPKGGGDDLNQQVTIEAIKHDITVDKWDVAYGCYPLATIETDSYWTLGTSELGTTAKLA